MPSYDYGFIAEVVLYFFNCLFFCIWSYPFSISFFLAFLQSFFVYIWDCLPCKAYTLVKDGRVWIFLPCSKTDIYGKGHWIYLNQCPLLAVCPIWLLTQFLMVHPEVNIFFIHSDGSALTKYHIDCVFHKKNQIDGGLILNCIYVLIILFIFLQENRRYIFWILGHSFVYWAQKRASAGTYTSNLNMGSLFNVYWSDWWGMKWDDLNLEFFRLLTYWPQPDILIIHLGGNDIGQVKTLDLIFDIQRTVRFLKLSFPELVIVFQK